MTPTRELINIVCPEDWLISWPRWHRRWQKAITQGVFLHFFFSNLFIIAITNRLACGPWHDKIIITMACISSSYLVWGVRPVPSVSCDSVIQSNSKPMNNSEYTQLSCKKKNTHSTPNWNTYIVCQLYRRVLSFSNFKYQVSFCKYYLPNCKSDVNVFINISVYQ